MDGKQYQELCERFEELLDLDEGERNVRLEQVRAENSKLGDDLARMLRSHEAAAENGFLDFEMQSAELTQTHTSVDGQFPIPPMPASIGNYQVIEQLGSGGMGVVYRAYDSDMDRQVAVKLIRTGEFADSEQVDRFRGEARAAAKMRHPNIVPVYEVGKENDCDFFTMALVEGKTLHEELNEGVMNSRQVARLVLSLAQAIEYAHMQGVVHRDIKPGNILMDKSTNEPQLTDFGLAKRTDVEESRTRTGQVLGTLRYMAPEQITDSKHVDERTDVYGLGATMYQCLTGLPPFSGTEMLMIFDKIKNQLPVLPRLILAEINPDLESVCMKCLQKDKRDRYQSAAELAKDLERYLANEPLQNSGSTWRRSIARVLRHQEYPDNLPSAKAAWWISVNTLFIHLAIFFVFWPTQQSHWVLWFVLLCGSACTGYINYVFHWSRYWHLTVSERQSAIVQTATHVALLCLFLIHGPLSVDHDAAQFLAIYPPYCLVIGVALIAHVGFSGQTIMLGSLFFPLAIFISHFPLLGPLSFAIVGALVCVFAFQALTKVVKNKSRD